MKKIVLLVFGLLFLASLVWGQASDLFISEYIEGGSNNKAVEIFNGTGSSVDLSNYRVWRISNGGNWPEASVSLTGSLADGDVYVVYNPSSVAGIIDEGDLSSSQINWNGDDACGLAKDISSVWTLIDAVGEDGVDPGSGWAVAGTSNATANHTLVRKSSVTGGNTDWDSSRGTDTSDSEWIVYNQDNFDYIGSHTMDTGSDTSVQFSSASATVSEGVGTYDLTLIIANEDATNATTCDVVLTVGDAADVNNYTTQGVTFPAASSANQTVTVTVTDDSSYEGDETLTFSIQNVAGGNSAAVGSTSDFDLTIDDNDPAITDLDYTETFDSNLGDCYTYSDSGATKEWYWSGGNAAMNGYNSGDVEVDWLVLPGIDFDSYSNEIMTFETMYNYNSINTDNYLKLYYSADYTGLGDPNSSTWTELSYTQPTATSTWTESGNIDLSGVSGSAVYIAFKYRGISGGYNQWNVDDISIAEVANIAPVISSIAHTPSSNIGTSTTVSVSADVTDSDGTISTVELHWGLSTGSLGTTITMSLDTGDTYETDTDIPAQSEGSTVYYEVYAVDNGSASTTSDEYDYYISDVADPEVGDLIITEVCGTGANAGDGFMEIYNASEHAISLVNVQARYWNSNPNNATPSPVIDLSGTISSDDYVVIARNSADFNTHYGFASDFSNSNFYFNGADDGADIYLNDGRAAVLDSFNDNGTTGSGHSAWTWNDDYVFERTSTGDGAIVTNWTELTSGIGTPGAENDTPLPVILSTFSAVYSNELLTINWLTQSESNNLGWNIYRSISNNIGQASQLNAELIQGAGTTSEPTSYSYVDNSNVENNTTYWYWLESSSYSGETDLYGPVYLTVQFEEDTPIIPESYGLYQNYPNPFNPSTSISFALEEASDVELIIYNIKGEKIKSIFNDHVNADETTISIWNGEDANGKKVSSGVYYYKLTTDTKVYQKKMLLVK